MFVISQVLSWLLFEGLIALFPQSPASSSMHASAKRIFPSTSGPRFGPRNIPLNAKYATLKHFSRHIPYVLSSLSRSLQRIYILCSRLVALRLKVGHAVAPSLTTHLLARVSRLLYEPIVDSSNLASHTDISDSNNIPT